MGLANLQLTGDVLPLGGVAAGSGGSLESEFLLGCLKKSIRFDIMTFPTL